MAIPEKPESRAEMYLNKIASGSGTIPAKPESRLEQYLDAIANNGGGGGSGGGVLVCTMNFTTGALDHTLQEILDAPFVVLKLEIVDEGESMISWCPIVGKVPWYDSEAQKVGASLYFVQYNTHESESVTYDLVGLKFHATNPTDYPAADMGE